MVDASSSSSAAQISIYGIEDEREREREREVDVRSYLEMCTPKFCIYSHLFETEREREREREREKEKALYVPGVLKSSSLYVAQYYSDPLARMCY